MDQAGLKVGRDVQHGVDAPVAHHPFGVVCRADHDRRVQGLGGVDLSHQASAEGGIVLVDDREGQFHRRLPGIGQGVVEGVGDHRQQQGAGQGAMSEHAGKGADEGGAEPLGRQVQAKVFRLGIAPGQTARQRDGHDEGAQGDARQDQQRRQGGAGVGAQHHLLVLKPQIMGEGQDAAPDLRKGRAVGQGQGAVRKGDGGPGVDGRGGKTDVHVPGQGDQQGRQGGGGGHQGDQTGGQHRQTALDPPPAPTAQPGDPDQAPQGEDDDIGRQLARQGGRQPAVHPRRPGLERAAAQFAPHAHHRRARHQQVQHAGRDQAA